MAKWANALILDGNSAPVPVGRTATATAPDGATINLRCDSRRRWVKH